MSKQKKEVAAVRSVSIKYDDPETGKKVTENRELTPERLEWSKQFITDFAKEYWRNPECPALVMRQITRDMEASYDVNTHQEDMDEAKIVEDAFDLFYIGINLKYNYSKYHDKACEKIRSIMLRHAPKVQRSIDKMNEAEKNRKSDE